MPARHPERPPHRSGLRWLAGAVSLGIAGAAAGIAILAAAPAGAAPISPSYHAGSDTATFSANGVRDSNCLVSAGGTEVWIKPGDKINFKSELAGINVGSLDLSLGKVSSLNVDATIDGKTSHRQSVAVRGTKTTAFPSSTQKALSTGEHALTWKVLSVSILGGLVPSQALSNGNLMSGAALSWSGVIHVTNDAPKCKLSVGTPKVGISAGPVHVTVPPVNVNVPVPALPKLPKLPGGGAAAPGGGKKTAPDQFHYTPPALTVPEQAMGGIGGGSGGGFDGIQPDANGATPLGNGLPEGAGAKPGSSKPGTGSAATAQPSTKRVELASNKPPAARLPVLLAIIAVIALSLVSAGYARLLLVRRKA